MENITNAQQVMGPGVPRKKVSTFNGQQQNFANWQNQLSKSYSSTQMDSMNPKCHPTFQELLASIKALEDKIQEFASKKGTSADEKKGESVQDIASLSSKKTH